MFGIITGWFTGKQYYVVAPEEGSRGRFYDSDPGERDPETRKKTARRPATRRVCRATGLPPNDALRPSAAARRGGTIVCL